MSFTAIADERKSHTRSASTIRAVSADAQLALKAEEGAAAHDNAAETMSSKRDRQEGGSAMPRIESQRQESQSLIRRKPIASTESPAWLDDLARHRRGAAPIALLIALLIAVPLLASAQATIDWWSVDGGGEIRSEGGDWTLSGTLGQWDGTEGNLLTGGAWQMTGGFWAVEAPASDGLFIDSFEN